MTIWYVLAHVTLSVTTILMLVVARNSIISYANRTTVRTISAIFEVMMRLLNETTSHRVLLIALHNGGKVLTLKSKKSITIIEEVHDSSVKPIKQDFQDYDVGSDVIRVLDTLMRDKQLIKNTNELQVGLFQDMQYIDQAESFALFDIGYAKGLYFYMLVSAHDTDQYYAPEQYRKLHIGQQKIKKLIYSNSFFTI